MENQDNIFQNKYIVSCNYGNRKDASSKALTDVEQILTNRGVGYKIISFQKRCKIIDYLKRKFPFFFKTLWQKYYDFTEFSLIKKINLPCKSILFFQYPLTKLRSSVAKRTSLITKLKQQKNLFIQIIIHDLYNLREGVSKDDFSFLKLADCLICHTPEMKLYLIRKGVIADKIQILYFFDYLHINSVDKTFLFRKKDDGICFAGNLVRGLFVSNLIKNSDKFFETFYLYGKLPNETKMPVNFHYEGVFDSTNLPYLKGSFGLVWDGDSIESCTGLLGEYLGYNSSHKNSLYMVCRLPIIIWSKAALCPFIIRNNLGISVDTIYEIHNKISKITDEQYKVMIESVDLFANRLENGESILSIINNKKIGI